MTDSRKLILRLSSLGDVVLATSALSVASVGRTDWVVARGFEKLLEGHPKIAKLWVFDRKDGLIGWLRLCYELWEQNYTKIYDLHSSLRTRIARIAFFLFDLSHFRIPRFQWKRVSKGRVRLWAYYLLKGFLLPFLRPRPWRERFTRLVGGEGSESPDLRYLIDPNVTKKAQLKKHSFVCLMPSSHWSGKQWPAERFVELTSYIEEKVVVLGTRGDRASQELLRLLKLNHLDVVNGVGKWDLRELASVLSEAKLLIGNDTGLAHLAEAVGTPVRTLFGPTTPDMGFAPLLSESQAIETPLWCRPCGKDGRFCYRPFDRYLCLKSVRPKQVLE